LENVSFFARSSGRSAFPATNPLHDENAAVLAESITSRMVGNPESAGINRHVGVSKEGWRIQ
jgi:hypothetical protein